MQRFDEVSRLPVLFPVVDEEILHRKCAPFVALAKRQCRAERDQHRRRIADRRAVCHIAADGPHIAHLFTADPVPVPPPVADTAGRQRLWNSV